MIGNMVLNPRRDPLSSRLAAATARFISVTCSLSLSKCSQKLSLLREVTSELS